MFQLVVDAILTAVLAIEILVAWIGVAKGSCTVYTESCSAKVDVAVLGVSLVCYLIMGVGASGGSKWVEVVDSSVLGIRFAVQVLRIAVWVKRTKVSRELANQADVDFEAFELQLSSAGTREEDAESMVDTSLGFEGGKE